VLLVLHDYLHDLRYVQDTAEEQDLNGAGCIVRGMDELEFGTERIKVRPWTDADVSWYLAALDDAIVGWTREPADLTEPMWHAARERTAASDRLRTGAITMPDGTPVGNLGLRIHDDVVELFYWIASEARDQGLATETVEASIGWVADRGLGTVVELQIAPSNAASIAVARKCGFDLHEYRLSDDSCAENGRLAVYRRSVSD